MSNFIATSVPLPPAANDKQEHALLLLDTRAWERNSKAPMLLPVQGQTKQREQSRAGWGQDQQMASGKIATKGTTLSFSRTSTNCVFLSQKGRTTQEPHFCSHADSSSSFESYVQHILPAVMLTKLHLCLSLTSMPSARTEHTCRLQHLRSTSPSTSAPPQTPTVVFSIELRRTTNS